MDIRVKRQTQQGQIFIPRLLRTMKDFQNPLRLRLIQPVNLSGNTVIHPLDPPLKEQTYSESPTPRTPEYRIHGNTNVPERRWLP
jgi:hypothetical protein